MYINLGHDGTTQKKRRLFLRNSQAKSWRGGLILVKRKEIIIYICIIKTENICIIHISNILCISQSSTNIAFASNMLAWVKLQPYITFPLVTVKVLCGIHNRCYESPTNLWCQPEYISNNIITRHVLRSYTNIFVITFWRYVVLLQGWDALTCDAKDTFG